MQIQSLSPRVWVIRGFVNMGLVEVDGGLVAGLVFVKP